MRMDRTQAEGLLEDARPPGGGAGRPDAGRVPVRRGEPDLARGAGAHRAGEPGAGGAGRRRQRGGQPQVHRRRAGAGGHPAAGHRRQPAAGPAAGPGDRRGLAGARPDPAHHHQDPGDRAAAADDPHRPGGDRAAASRRRWRPCARRLAKALEPASALIISDYAKGVVAAGGDGPGARPVPVPGHPLDRRPQAGPHGALPGRPADDAQHQGTGGAHRHARQGATRNWPWPARPWWSTGAPGPAGHPQREGHGPVHPGPAAPGPPGSSPPRPGRCST